MAKFWPQMAKFWPSQKFPGIYTMIFSKKTARVVSIPNKRAMLRSLGGGQIKKKHIKTTAANLRALKLIIIIITRIFLNTKLPFDDSKQLSKFLTKF